MAKAPSLQFYPGDVQRDTALNSVSLAAYGLWHRMMWVMFDGVPYGHLSVNGSVIPPVNLSLLLRVPVDQLEPLISELETAGVCSRNEAGVIYSRRMVRDAKRREVNAANGSKGGNPRLSKSVNRRVKGEVIPLTADAVSNTVLTQERKERAKEKQELVWPAFAGEKVKAKWAEFIAYRIREKKQRYRSVETEQKALDLAARYFPNGPDFVAALDHSMARTWQFPVDPAEHKYPQAEGSPVSAGWNPRA